MNTPEAKQQPAPNNPIVFPAAPHSAGMPGNVALQGGAAPMPPYLGTMLPADFILPYGATPESPMPRYIPEPGPTGILVHTSYYRWSPSPLTFKMIKPLIIIDGKRIPDVDWGETHIPLLPGVYHVRVGTAGSAWAERLGQATFGDDSRMADAMIPVVADHVTTTYYRQPVMVILRAMLGPQPHEKAPGQTWAMICNTVLYSWLFAMLVLLIVQLLR